MTRFLPSTLRPFRVMRAAYLSMVVYGALLLLSLYLIRSALQSTQLFGGKEDFEEAYNLVYHIIMNTMLSLYVCTSMMITIDIHEHDDHNMHFVGHENDDNNNMMKDHLGGSIASTGP
jgi:hypothetical protein